MKVDLMFAGLKVDAEDRVKRRQLIRCGGTAKGRLVCPKIHL